VIRRVVIAVLCLPAVAMIVLWLWSYAPGYKYSYRSAGLFSDSAVYAWLAPRRIPVASPCVTLKLWSRGSTRWYLDLYRGTLSIARMTDGGPWRPPISGTFFYRPQRTRTLRSAAFVGFKYEQYRTLPQWDASCRLTLLQLLRRDVGTANALISTAEIPLWGLFVLSAFAPAVLFCRRVQRWDRRRKGMCRQCAYDLTGNVSGVCPECGRPA
jgi:hypothetical protein